MELILWRHAEAEDGFPDLERALTQKGLRQAQKTAEFLTPRLPDDVRILVSPATRTQQTAQALGRKFVTSTELSVHSSARRILAAVQWPACGGTTVVVGHQPCLGQVAALLISGREDSWSVRKGAIWWLWQRRPDADITIRTVIDPDCL